MGAKLTELGVIYGIFVYNKKKLIPFNNPCIPHSLCEPYLYVNLMLFAYLLFLVTEKIGTTNFCKDGHICISYRILTMVFYFVEVIQYLYFYIYFILLLFFSV